MIPFRGKEWLCLIFCCYGKQYPRFLSAIPCRDQGYAAICWTAVSLMRDGEERGSFARSGVHCGSELLVRCAFPDAADRNEQETKYAA